jgi:hypothetical protein
MTHQWQPIRTGPLTQADWPRWLAQQVPLDPYLIWADITCMAGYSQTDGAKPAARWPILLELSGAGLQVPASPPDCNACQPGSACHPGLGLVNITEAYIRRGEKQPPVNAFRFVTADVAAACIGELLAHPELFVRFQLGLPRVPVASGDKARTAQWNQAPTQVVIGVIDDGFAFAHSEFFSTDSKNARTKHIWDQNGGHRRSDRNDWLPVTAFNYGYELADEAIEKAVLLADTPGGYRAYAQLDYVPRRPDAESTSLSLSDPLVGVAPAGSMITATHGTAVLALAAGRSVPLDGTGMRLGHKPNHADDGPDWPLILVQLPSRTSLDSSGGSLGVHVLDGLHFITQRARGDKAGPTPNPVVVNISYGAIAGPHDGTTMLECAINDLVTKYAQLWVVLAAGNAHGSKTHARLELEEQGPRKSLTWTIGPDNLLESYLEIWLPDVDTEGHGLNPSWLERVMVTLTPPGGLPTLPSLRACHAHCLVDSTQPGSLPIAAAVFSRRVAQGLRGTMVLLAVARTRRPLAGDQGRAVPVAPHGRWLVTLGWAEDNQPTGRRAAIHAWAERNDQLWGHGRRQQTTVEGDDPLPAKTEWSPTVREFSSRGAVTHHLDEVPRPFQPDITHGSVADADQDATPLSMLLNQAAKGHGTAVAVGGYRLSDQEMASYSGGGPTRSAPVDRGRLPGGSGAALAPPPFSDVDLTAPVPVRNHGPRVDAPSDLGTAVHGLRTIGLRDGSVARLGGTSAAAPLVTRYIASRLQQQLDQGTGAPAMTLVDGDKGPLSDLAPERRATLTPTQDDRFRRGQERLAPGGPSKP